MRANNVIRREKRMNRPYIICHMMSSVDGRIDCAMTEKLPGVEEYYSTLGELNAATTLSGKTTAKLELAESGEFKPSSAEKLCKEAFSKKADARGYEVITDTKGTLLWQDEAEKPRVVITSEQVSKDYIDYLDGKNISWIACGKNGIDLARACEILFDEFGVRRMAIVGGGRGGAQTLPAGLSTSPNFYFWTSLRRGWTRRRAQPYGPPCSNCARASIPPYFSPPIIWRRQIVPIR